LVNPGDIFQSNSEVNKAVLVRDVISTDQLLILQCSEKARSYLYIGPAVCQCDAVPNDGIEIVSCIMRAQV